MRVAIKALLPEVSASSEFVQRFEREAVLLGRVRSDRVARIVDFFVDPKCGALLVTEYIEGESLAETAATVRLGVEGAVDLGIELSRAVGELHRAHIVHRDLKPGNVILQPTGNGQSRAVLVDLGVSRLLPQGDDSDSDELTDITRTDIVLGTTGYMAPEQILNPRAVTVSADLYALGAVLFRMVAGHNVFGNVSHGEQLRAKLHGRAPRLETGRTDRVARGLEGIVSRALERDPAARYASADEMLVDLMVLHERSRDRAPVARGLGSGATGRRAAPLATVSALGAIAALACGAVAVACGSRTLRVPIEPPREAARLSTTGDRADPSGDASVCGEWDDPRAPHVSKATPPPLEARQEAPPRRVTEPIKTHSQRTRDADLLRAIERAVAEEAYMTRIAPSQAEESAAWTSLAPPGAGLAARR